MKKRGSVDHHEIIVKRRSKKGHGDEHGGAWKVAFADFTLAMMALFMVLWLVQPQNDLQRASDGDQVSNPLVEGGAGVFDGISRTPLDMDGIPVQVSTRQDKHNEARNPQEDPGAEMADRLPGEARQAPHQLQTQVQEGSTAQPQFAHSLQMQELAQLMETVALELDAQANVVIEVVPQGLRILIKDDQKRFMFPRGSARLDRHFETLLQRLAKVLARVDNRLIISGHTDATPYRGVVIGSYNNWNLSGDRALRARNVLVEAGLPAQSVLQVTAQADGMPLLPDDPQNGANRRIELLLLTDQAQQLYQELFGEGQSRAEYRADGAKLREAAAGSPEV